MDLWKGRGIQLHFFWSKGQRTSGRFNPPQCFYSFHWGKKRNLSLLSFHGKGSYSDVCVCVCVCVLGWDGYFATTKQFSESTCSVPSLSHVWLFATLWITAHHASLSITISWSLLNFMSIVSVMPFIHLIVCHPLLLQPSIFPSLRVFFQWVSSLYQVAKVLELQLQHQSFQWTPRTDFL